MANRPLESSKQNPEALLGFTLFMILCVIGIMLFENFAEFMSKRNKPRIQHLDELIEEKKELQSRVSYSSKKVEVLSIEIKDLELQKRKLQYWEFYIHPTRNSKDEQLDHFKVFSFVGWTLAFVFFMVVPFC